MANARGIEQRQLEFTTEHEIVAKLSDAFVKAIARPEVRERFLATEPSRS